MDHHNFYIYSNNDFSQKSAGGTRMRYYARALAGDSHQVYLVSCCSSPISDDKFVEIEPNIFVLENKEVTSNFFKTFGFLRALFSFAKSRKGNSSFLYYPYPLVSLEILGLLYLKGYKRKPVFRELNEVTKYSSYFHAPGSVSNLKYSIKKIVFKTVFTIMDPLMYFYDGLICISTSIEKYGSRFNKNTLRIPILTDPDQKTETSDKRYIKEGSFNIGFSGSIHPSKEDLENFISVISSIKERGYNVSFNLCGSIFKDYKDRFLNELVSREEINYYGNLNQTELSTFLDQQDLLVVPRGYSLQNKYGFSTKISDYLNHQKMVLLTDISDNALYIEDGINGFIVPPNDPDQMRQKLIYIIENFEELRESVLPKALNTSKTQFYYANYKDDLRAFLMNRASESNTHS